ncbi:unnamed protein product [Camellia sinensis]
MSGGTPIGGAFMRQRHSQGYTSGSDDHEDDACSRASPQSPSSLQQKTRRRWVEIMENVLWIASAVFIIYYGDRHSNFIVILWHDDRIRRTTNNKRKNKFKVFVKELFVIYLLDQHQHYDRLLEYLDTTTPFSGFGIKKMGESKVQRVNTYSHAACSSADGRRQSKTALEEGKLEDAVSCRAKLEKPVIEDEDEDDEDDDDEDDDKDKDDVEVVTNSRGDVLQCSHYMPVVRREGKALPCVFYCHGNRVPARAVAAAAVARALAGLPPH